jgi:phosphoribosylformimino-5-aminoimidazole carboxamide ribotide isomerase
MLIIPAVDIIDGCVVRLFQGRSNKKIYSRDPLKTAKHWVNQGAEMLHVVDLDGAFTGKPRNLPILSKIVKSIAVPVEFGGGVRNIETIDKLLNMGVSRVVLGTKAVTDKKFLNKVIKEFKDRVIVSVDAKSGKVMIEGWKSGFKNTDAVSFALNLKAAGFKEIIYTDTAKDGMLSGPNIQMLKKMLKDTGMKVIASGGISTLKDITVLRALEKKGVTGVIIGKAIYEGRFTLPQAIRTSTRPYRIGRCASLH